MGMLTLGFICCEVCGDSTIIADCDFREACRYFTTLFVKVSGKNPASSARSS